MKNKNTHFDKFSRVFEAIPLWTFEKKSFLNFVYSSLAYSKLKMENDTGKQD